MKPKIYGLELDAAGRCRHYHLEVDVAAMRCALCGRFYACYRCHDALCDHVFVPSEPHSQCVMCGVCGTQMPYATYAHGSCPQCHHAFNPRCALHHDHYFKP